jgi:hypothetical protein
MVRTGTDVSFYLDGSFNSTVADSHTFSANQTHYVSDPVSGSWILNGIIDDLRVYDVALDADQVALIYNSGAGTETTALGGSAPAAMNLTSTTNTLDFVPTTCRTLVQLTDHEGTLAASQIVVQVSRDAGTTWGTASLGASVFSVSNYVWSANLSLTNQPSGSNVMLRAILTNGAPNCTVWGWAVPCGVEE